MTKLADLVAAKRALLLRWRDSLVRSAGQASALRRAGRFAPDVPLNLVGVGVGEKVTAGRRTGEACVKVLVARKYPLGRIGRSQRIPPRVEDLPTDVEEVGYPRALPESLLPAARPPGSGRGRRARASHLDPRRSHRPVPGGVSVGLDRGAVPYRYAGTLGAVLVARADPSQRLGLSNNHVLADENRAPIGAGVIQPGSLDGGREVDRIGILERFEPLRFGNVPNSMDAAVASLGPDLVSTPEILGLGLPTGIAEPELDMPVRKVGRTTGLTEGVVRAVRFDVTGVQYEQGMVRVDDVVVIEAARGKFSDAGDSGSAILDESGRLVALLFAGSPRVTFAIPMPRVARRLGLALPGAAARKRAAASRRAARAGSRRAFSRKRPALSRGRTARAARRR